MSNAGYALIYEPDSTAKKSATELKILLEKSKDDIKISTMKQIITSVLNGDVMPDLLMHIIRFVMPSKNKELKRLLYFYWEVCSKHDDDGKMRHEMILVCNAIQHDLQHPNEYVRGNTLRFLCKLKEPELLETLVPNVRQCLLHRHAYVRKNAVFALYSIYKVSNHLIPDAPTLVSDFLREEFDSVCKRNAFVCLCELDRDAALQFIEDNMFNIETSDPLLQLAFVEFIRKDAKSTTNLKSQYANLLTAILETSSDAVVYEAANTLTILSGSAQTVLLAGSKFVELLTKEADNNVKIITLERINELNKKFPGILQSLSLDILSVLSTQDIDVRRKALEVTLSLVSNRNVEDVVKLLKNELQKSTSLNDEKSSEYRQSLVNSIHQLAIDFGEVATNVIDLLLESISELTTEAASDVITFVKEVVEKFPEARNPTIKKLAANLFSVKSGKVFRGALWILGEYSEDESAVRESWKFLRSAIGDVPFITHEDSFFNISGNKDVKGISSVNESSHPVVKRGPIVLPDGTYATENALTATYHSVDDEDEHQIRKLILAGDFYLASVLASTLVKLVLRLEDLQIDEKHFNALKAEALLIMVSILRAGEIAHPSTQIDEDSADRILDCVRFLTDIDNTNVISEGFLQVTKNSFQTQIKCDQSKESRKDVMNDYNSARVDDAITFRLFENQSGSRNTDDDEEGLVISGRVAKNEGPSSKLNKIVQLTGFSDPIYAEAFVKVRQFDVTLDVLLVNQTTATMRNLSVEFATLGDLKVVDKPSAANIGPHGFHKVSVTVKVTSADTGIIFGNIVYDGRHSDESSIVILNDVHVDIMDYIKPATCSESVFRKMWNEFEWENKISINSPISSLEEYLNELLKGTKMSCLTPGAVVGKECRFLAANLYSRSSFGEDALANLSIEKQGDGHLVGHVKIRSKGQGLALSLGDRVASISRQSKISEAIVV